MLTFKYGSVCEHSDAGRENCSCVDVAGDNGNWSWGDCGVCGENGLCKMRCCWICAWRGICTETGLCIGCWNVGWPTWPTTTRWFFAWGGVKVPIRAFGDKLAIEPFRESFPEVDMWSTFGLFCCTPIICGWFGCAETGSPEN